MKKTLKISSSLETVSHQAPTMQRERFFIFSFSQRKKFIRPLCRIGYFFFSMKKREKKLSKEEWKKKKKKSLNIFLHINFAEYFFGINYLQLIDHNVRKKTKETKSNSEKKTFKRKSQNIGPK